MTTNFKLSNPNASDPGVWDQLQSILAQSNADAGTALVADQTLLEARLGERRIFEISLEATSTERAQDSPTKKICGFVILGLGELDLVVAPESRGLGAGRFALESILRDVVPRDARLTVWVHGEQPAATHLLSSHRFAPGRVLLKLELDPDQNSSELDSSEESRSGFEFSTFTIDDSAAWVALNAEVFAAHPEQGSLTEADLAARTGEEWFNPEDFILLRQGQTLIGYCWLKVWRGEGEIYAIGVSPALAGQGLGAMLLTRGLKRLRERNVARITLYVEGDNEPALKLYSSRGFRVELRSTQWVRSGA